MPSRRPSDWVRLAGLVDLAVVFSIPNSPVFERRTMIAESDSVVAPVQTKPRLNWKSVIWITGMHVGALFAPFVFTWSGLVVFSILYVLTGLGVTLGYHR